MVVPGNRAKGSHLSRADSGNPALRGPAKVAGSAKGEPGQFLWSLGVPSR